MQSTLKQKQDYQKVFRKSAYNHVFWNNHYQRSVSDWLVPTELRGSPSPSTVVNSKEWPDVSSSY